MTLEFPDTSWKEYALVDTGDGEKLERFGTFTLRRPEPKALWTKSLSEREWDRLAHTCFKLGASFGKAGKEESGLWVRRHRMDDQWPLLAILQVIRDGHEPDEVDYEAIFEKAIPHLNTASGLINEIIVSVRNSTRS